MAWQIFERGTDIYETKETLYPVEALGMYRETAPKECCLPLRGPMCTCLCVCVCVGGGGGEGVWGR